MFRKSLLLLAFAVACTKSSSNAPAIPDAPASITGRITVVQQSGDGIGSVRVEANPEGSSGSAAQAVVRITATTTVTDPAAGTSGFSSLTTGQWVRVWFVGPVMQSQPLQATAGTIVVDSAARR
jgi:hypothetical protein